VIQAQWAKNMGRRSILREVRFGQAGAMMQSSRPHLEVILRKTFPLITRRNDRNIPPSLLSLSPADGEPQERELDMLVRATPVVVLAGL